MNQSTVLYTLKPNVTSLGYALFLAINAAGVWGGVFPFLPLEFQTSEILHSFFLAQALTFSLSYFVSAVGVYYFPGPTRKFLVSVVSVPYFAGWCCLIGAIYFHDLSLVLVTIGGCLLGVGSAGFYMLWQRLFASQDDERGNRDLIVGTAYSAVFYFALYIIPEAVTVFLIPLVFLPLFGLCIVLKSRTINLKQPMFEDIPKSHPKIYKQVIKDYWRSAFAFGALGFCSGIIRSLAVGDPEVGSVVNMMSMGACFIAALILLTFWQVKNVRMNITVAYRVFFPFLITAFLLLPAIGPSFLTAYSGVLYAFYSASIILMMIHCAQASRDRGINPVFIYGFFGGVVYFLHDIGFIVGTLAERVMIIGVAPLTAVALVALYLLGLMYFIGQGGFRSAISSGQATAEHIELIALQKPSVSKKSRKKVQEYAPAEPDLDVAPTTLEQSHTQYKDRISKQAALLQQHYRLSARETEVMELIARGNSVARIAENLVVSENTIRTHSKRIYAKLAIHKKQELLDLINEFQP